MKERVRYYRGFSDEFTAPKNQDYTLPEDYVWLNEKAGFRALSALVYGLAILFSEVYCRLFLKVRFRNRKVLRKAGRGGAFLFGNHTLPVGDVFDPAIACLPRRIHTVASPANYALPVIGKLLPYLGALPVSGSLSGMKKLNEAIETRLSQDRFIVFYPEAHVWEYCPFLRPFSDTSFKYPVKYEKPSYCITTTFHKPRIGRRPRAVLYIDGPFYTDHSLSKKEQAAQLKRQITAVMRERCLESDYAYIEYRPFDASTD